MVFALVADVGVLLFLDTAVAGFSPEAGVDFDLPADDRLAIFSAGELAMLVAPP